MSGHSLAACSKFCAGLCSNNHFVHFCLGHVADQFKRIKLNDGGAMPARRAIGLHQAAKLGGVCLQQAVKGGCDGKLFNFAFDGGDACFC